MATSNRQVRLAARPAGFPKRSDFEMTEDPIPEPGEGEVLVRNSYISVDPYMRGRMNDVKSYVPPFENREPMQGAAAGVVVRSRHADFAEGDAVTGSQSWREYDLVPGKGLRKLDLSLAPMPAYLGVMGGTGLTAYVGLLDLGEPRQGETVFVSAAAGAVGSIVGQIAKLQGCRAVGSAGSDDKVAYLRDELGFDAAFNYKSADLEQALAEHCPDGIDVYFENVGGDHLQAALNHLNPFGRVPVCGMISQYNNAEPAPGPNNLAMIVRKRLKLQGFIVSDHLDRRPAFEQDMGRWLREGKVQHRETIVEGIENAVDAFLGMLQGQNTGKMLVKVGPEPGEA
ncbi:MAG: NADP-dependent oxidoreductase [Dehalococcoidia bacterium]|nr:NADP-dependent oxidoreductase [Dehalococcoidia bacterium]